MKNESSFNAARDALKIIKDKTRFNVRVYFGRYIAYFNDTQIFISYNKADDCYDFNIKWGSDTGIPFSVLDMNLSSVYSSDTSDFKLLNNLLCFMNDLNKIEIELF